jgi:hypothetical protein
VKKLIIGFGLVLSTVLILGSSAFAEGVYPSGSVGNDVSWPNCTQEKSDKKIGIVGVTGGLDFHPNNCLTTEASWYKNLTLYTNTDYPGQSYGLEYQNSPRACGANDLNCLAYNYGYNAGLYAINYAQSQGVSSSTWWLDVETDNSWTTDYQQNKTSLRGEIDALTKAGVTTIGIYSTTDQWQSITNNWHNQLPNWLGTAVGSAGQAAQYCTGYDFTGGGTWIVQFKGRLDRDYFC